MKTLEERLTDLEIRYSEQEDTLQKLDLCIREQQEQIEKLVAGLRHFSERVQGFGGDVPVRDLTDEKPPHY